MDSKETLIRKSSASSGQLAISQFPIVGVIIVLMASAAFYLCHTHDQKVWSLLFDYHSKYLLKTEKPLYQDFYNKRLQIENIGSEGELASIQEAVKLEDNNKLTKFILSDRSFRIFLEKKAAIYFSHKEKTYWLTHNKAIKQILNGLSTYQFSVIPERFIASPKISNLLSYIFIDQQATNFFSNIILLLLLCIMIERAVRRIYLAGFIISFSLIYASLYLSIAHSFSKPLFGLNALIYILIALSASVFIQRHFRTRFAHKKSFLIIGVTLIYLKITQDIAYQTLSKESLYALLPLLFAGIINAQTIYRFTCRTMNSIPEAQKTIPILSESTRASYAEALNALSRFNFTYARQRLRLLIEAEPNSGQILESSYHLEKLLPEEAMFGKLAQRRIEDALIKQDYPAMYSIFQDIQISTPSRGAAKKYIEPDYYLKMLVVFLQNNNIEKAEHAFMFLELAGQISLVQEACKLLIEAFSEKQLLKKKAQYQALYQSYLVDT